MGKRQEKDKFYTKPAIAEQCIKTVNLKKYDTVIEPSAGGGAFSNRMDCIPIDIEPEFEDMWCADFLEVNLEEYGKTLVIGNPPFGERNSLTKAFIKHSISFDNVYTVAFILPKTWMKYTLQSTFPDGWWLRRSDVLPTNSFLVDGYDYHVPCVWQVWERGKSVKDKRDIKVTYHPRFTLSSKYQQEASFFILGAAPSRVIPIDEVSPTQRGYYVTSGDENLKQEFIDTDWKALSHSGVNGGVSWCTASDIYKGIKE